MGHEARYAAVACVYLLLLLLLLLLLRRAVQVAGNTFLLYK